ncbi:MAG: class I SAM-dependent methyltransferase [Terracidiphilus sp.]|jgi:2-polyprenyl-3-methyl-5-hydroxy-6-metoxy-1,4-benzoquinol methylase
MHATFRDPAGQLHLTPTHALRRIYPAAVEETRAFLASPLRKALERSGDLISTEVMHQPDSAAESAELWLQHPRIDPISYPWEWTTGQWRSAAELTLRLADQAIDAGWTLKDATPLNILFKGARPVLVDVLSFERRDPHSSVWLAYGQFVRTFLLPLVAEKLLSWPLQSTIFARDGYEPRTIYNALGPLQRLNPDLLDVVTLATVFEESGSKESKSKPTKSQPTKSQKKPSTTDPELAAHILHKRIARLRKQIARAARSETSSRWSGYQQSAVHYRPSDTEEKQRFVAAVLERCRPARVLDIGANTGTYSLLASKAGAQVVALDSDSAAIEALGRTASEQSQPITAMVANIARPTPAVGWRNQEQLSLLQRLTGEGRLTGKFDLVLMLAVIHHLILREQLPLPHIADLCASLTSRWLVLEWVPPADPMFQEWLRGRDDLYGSLSEDDLKLAFAPFFHVADRAELGNHRVLFLFERNQELENDHAGAPGERIIPS